MDLPAYARGKFFEEKETRQKHTGDFFAAEY